MAGVDVMADMVDTVEAGDADGREYAKLHIRDCIKPVVHDKIKVKSSELI